MCACICHVVCTYGCTCTKQVIVKIGTNSLVSVSLFYLTLKERERKFLQLNYMPLLIYMHPGENVGKNTRTICENYALFSRAISSDCAHFLPFAAYSRVYRERGP